MSEHFPPAKISGLFEDWLSPRSRRKVVAHLLGCPRCASLLVPPPVEEADYEAPISSAIGKVEARIAERQEARRWFDEWEGRPSFADFPFPEKRRRATWGLVEVLMEKSVALRHENPRRMVELAELAVDVIGSFRPLRYGYRETKDLEARAWGELANAYRVSDQLDRAEEVLSVAFEFFDQGTGDLLLLARLDDLAASLFVAQRRFDEAFRSLDEAYAIYREVGERHAAGRILISAGLFTGYEGEHEEGISLIHRGLLEIDRGRDPGLVYSAFQNILLFTVEMEEYEEGRDLLNLLRPLVRERAGRVDQVKVGWIEGKIAAGLGESEWAEKLLSQAQAELKEAGLFYIAALAGLDFAALLLQMGRTEELGLLVREMLETFRSLKVEREAIAAILLLKRAIARDRLSLELLLKVKEILRRIAGSF